MSVTQFKRLNQSLIPSSVAFVGPPNAQQIPHLQSWILLYQEFLIVFEQDPRLKETAGRIAMERGRTFN